MAHSLIYQHISRGAWSILSGALVLGSALPGPAQIVGQAHRDEHVGGYLIVPHVERVVRQ